MIRRVLRVERSAIYAQGIAVNPEMSRKTVIINATQSSDGTSRIGAIIPVIGGRRALAAATIMESIKMIP